MTAPTRRRRRGSSTRPPRTATNAVGHRADEIAVVGDEQRPCPGRRRSASSSTSQLGRSRWFVGSSSTSRLTGLTMILARASRRALAARQLADTALGGVAREAERAEDGAKVAAALARPDRGLELLQHGAIEVEHARLGAARSTRRRRWRPACTYRPSAGARRAAAAAASSCPHRWARRAPTFAPRSTTKSTPLSTGVAVVAGIDMAELGNHARGATRRGKREPRHQLLALVGDLDALQLLERLRPGSAPGGPWSPCNGSAR